jgi:hypothetical protein
MKKPDRIPIGLEVWWRRGSTYLHLAYLNSGRRIGFWRDARVYRLYETAGRHSWQITL